MVRAVARDPNKVVQSELDAVPGARVSRNPPPSGNTPEIDVGHIHVPPQLESRRGAGRTS